MAYTKKEEFTPQEIRVAQLGKALSHPARVAIIKLLLKRQECVCGAIVEELPLSQSTVSQHLKELKTVGLIKGEIDGPRVCYCIDPKVWAEARKHFGLFFENDIITKAC
ncbi:MAG TPA: metalloregulator ArsR/SmtB family transcription factor [Bacteroidota bacterium]